MRRVLVLAAHPDDAEFGCGASIDKFVNEGIEVHVAVFSPCNKSLPKGFDKGAIYQEFDQSMDLLGVQKTHLYKFDFEVRTFPNKRQEILEELIVLKNKVDFDLVILPNSLDIHQDHHTIYQEGFRAFKTCRLIGYELPWNSLEFKSNFHITLSEANLAQKFAAISCYKSQQKRSYFDFDFFKGLAKIRGVQINAAFAEAFECIRWKI